MGFVGSSVGCSGRLYKNWQQLCLSLNVHPFVIWLQFHLSTIGVYFSTQSVPAFWLVSTSKIWQNHIPVASQGLKRYWAFGFIILNLAEPKNKGLADLLEGERPGEERRYPSWGHPRSTSTQPTQQLTMYTKESSQERKNCLDKPTKLKTCRIVN